MYLVWVMQELEPVRWDQIRDAGGIAAVVDVAIRPNDAVVHALSATSERNDPHHRGPLAWCEHLQRVANGDRRRIEHLRFAIWHTAPPLENHEARIVRPVEIVERRLVTHRLG